MTCENCVSFKVCHAVALAGKVVNAEVQCDYFIDKDLINRQKAEIKRLNGVIKNFKATKERQKAEIERLQERLNHSIGVDNTKENGCFPFD